MINNAVTVAKRLGLSLLLGGMLLLAAGSAGAGCSGSNATGTAPPVAGLVVLGQTSAVALNGRVPLADWGYLVTLEETSTSTTGAQRVQKFHGFVTALDVHLTAAHGGLPAGSQIQIGYAETTVQGAPPSQQKPPPPAQKHKTGKPPAPPGKQAGGYRGPVLSLPSGLHPQLTAGGYVFPVY